MKGIFFFFFFFFFFALLQLCMLVVFFNNEIFIKDKSACTLVSFYFIFSRNYMVLF